MKQLLAPLLFLCFQLPAQSCLQNLEEAQIAYFNGRFSACIELLESCAPELKEKADRVKAYELLAKSFEMIKSRDKALIAMQNLLQEDPFYRTRPSLSISLEELRAQFKLQKQWHFGLEASYLQNNLEALKYWSFSGDAAQQTVSASPGLQFGLWSSYQLWRGLRLQAGVYYQWLETESSELQQGYLLQSSSETYQFWKPSFGLEYEQDLKRLSLFLGAGASLQFLQSAQGDLRFDPQESDFPTAFPGFPEKIENADLSFQRQKMLPSLYLEFGIRVPFGYNQVQLSYRYSLGQRNMVLHDERYSKEVFYQNLGYIPDDYILHTGSISISFVRSIIRPKRRML